MTPSEKPDPQGPTIAPWVLRPGRYAITTTVGAANSSFGVELHSSIRRSSFQIIDAGFDGSALELSPRGQDGLGFNVLLPQADRPNVSAAWSKAAEPLIVATPPGDAALPGLWLPPITDPLRRAKGVSDSSSEASSAAWFAPSFEFELSYARDRDRDRPAVVLARTSPRDPVAWQLERNLAFVAGQHAVAAGPLAGSAPADEPAASPRLMEAVTAANKLAARLGTVFTAMPATRCNVALLVSPSPGDPGEHHRALIAWIAGQTIHQPMDILTPADVIDGTLARHYRAAVVVSADPADSALAGTLGRYAESGGVVLLPDDIAADIPGATRLGTAIDTAHFAAIDKLLTDGKSADAIRLRRPAALLRAAEPLARAMKTKLEVAGVRPAMECDQPTVLVTRHAYGDVEYFFVVNATPDDAAGSEPLAAKASRATLSLPLAGGPVYDAISGQPAGFKSDGVRVAATLRLGAGQLRAFARTARPIGGVQVSSPQVVSHYQGPLPIRLELGASVADTDGRTLNGAIPLRVRVIDSLGVVRYDLWRSTERGMLRLDLPLAVNDPAGRWTVSVQELLSMTAGQSAFDYRPPTQTGVIAELSTGFDLPGGRPRRERPASTSIAPASKATRPGEATLLWRASMPDRVVSLQEVQQKLTVFSHDGTATQIDPGGKVLSQDPAPVIASPRPSEPLPKTVADHVLKDRRIKRSATEAGLTAVCYWGGMVQIFGPDGAARTEQVMPSGVADLLWLDGKLIVGLSDGEVVALKAGE